MTEERMPLGEFAERCAALIKQINALLDQIDVATEDCGPFLTEAIVVELLRYYLDPIILERIRQ